MEREVNTLGESHKQLLEKAIIKLTIPQEQGLAMKADLALPWCSKMAVSGPSKCKEDEREEDISKGEG